MKCWQAILVSFVFSSTTLFAELPGDKLLADYFRDETRKLADACLADIQSLNDWEQRKPVYRKQLFEMLGLDPMPPKSDLKATITGRIERDDFTVEKLHFQSMPGLYVTANFYLPKETSKPVPTILYLCGHAKVITNGISMGNKTAYQHHGIWFARNGYACLIVDTLQLGEIEGLHHGTHNLGQWWWNSRGYTPAGVEAWNNIRALDYLETRPEVDMNRVGATGRSGGGAYSWVIGALDDRIAVSAPVAGITDLENYVVDGKVEGHCDCMFHVNTYRWDYPLLAAMTAPRPLLFCNSDKDRIFPLEGVVRTHNKVRDIYRLYGATNQFGLLITEGDHKDTQDLQLPVFRWFNRFLKKEDPVISMAAVKLFEPRELKVFETLLSDAINARIQETFVPQASGSVMDDQGLRRELRRKVFGGWPADMPSPKARLVGTMNQEGLRLSVYEFESQQHVPLRMYVMRPHEREPSQVHLHVVDEQGWKQWLSGAIGSFSELLVQEGKLGKTKFDKAQFADLQVVMRRGEALVVFPPRGIGLTAWTYNPKKETHIRRRYNLLGQTLDGMRVWDITAAAVATSQLFPGCQLIGKGRGAMGMNLLLASRFGNFQNLELEELPKSLNTSGAPEYLNILQTVDVSLFPRH